ncbi:MAG TPA: hypothetical protein VGI00_02905 [Streptosporangiaceae bacterium]|jgi:hypothetical protein
MERGNTKHGPLRDDELKQDTENMVGSDPQPGRVEEGREPEPLDDPRELFEADTALTEEEAIELRSELARLLTRDEFPLTRHALLAILDEKGASPALADRVSSLPGRTHYPSTHDLLEALNLAHPEEDAGQGS